MLLLPCPRCGSSMQEIPHGPRWFAHWICRECDSAWRFEGRTMVQGRTPREIAPRPRRQAGMPRRAAVSHKPFHLTP